jgi:hypothetical protein
VLAAVGIAAAGTIGFAVGHSTAEGIVSVRTVTVKASAVETETKTVRVEATKTASASAQPAAAGIPEGTHVVGRDVEPGEYRTAGPLGRRSCYWARLSATTGAFEAILANGNTEGPTTVTILAGDRAFETSGCQGWTKVG